MELKLFIVAALEDAVIKAMEAYALQESKQKEEAASKRFGYFYNEKGDYTLTLDGEPFAIARDEAPCIELMRHISSKSLRIDVQSKTISECLEGIKEKEEKD
jgi:hypothetical protein